MKQMYDKKVYTSFVASSTFPPIPSFPYFFVCGWGEAASTFPSIL